MRYFLQIAYNGAAYAGWQIQPNAITVQEVVEGALKTISGGEIQAVVGCGRTDTGVHASSYVLHFDSENTQCATDQKWLYKLNGVLPKDVVAYACIQVKQDAHARFDATEREYKYIVNLKGNPFSNHLGARVFKDLDIEKMNEGAKHLIGTKDFTSFCKLHSDNLNNNCELYRAEWTKAGDSLIFSIAANRFLRNMVRAVVGTLFMVGEGKLTPDEVKTILEKQNRSAAGSSAPAQGLYLYNIKYPYIKDEFGTNSLSFWRGI